LLSRAKSSNYYVFNVTSGIQGTNTSPLIKKNAALLHNDPKDKVWTQGCIESLKSWINRNLYIVAGFAVGIALMQVGLDLQM